MKLNRITPIVAACVIGGLTFNARAQIGSGWTSTNENFKIQTSGCGSVSGNTFSITCGSSGSTKDRAEREYTAWSSGTHQFQGDCTVTSFGGNGINVKQTFQQNTGPWNMLALKNSGTLYEVSNGKTIGSFTVGSSFRINTVLDASHGTVDVYFNGTFKETLTGGTTPIYDKIGTYRLDSGTGPITATWNNVLFWYGGKTNAGSGGVTLDTTGIYQIQNEASGLVLNQQGSLTNGSKISQWSSSSTSQNLQWQFSNSGTSSGYYQIVSVKSGKDAVVQSASTAAGAGIIQWSFGSAGNDQWQPTQNSDGSYTFHNLHSGLVLGDPAGSTSTSTQMDQETSNGGSNQKWNLIKQ